MKKLRLKDLSLLADELLQKDDLRSIHGGYDGFWCAHRYAICDSVNPNNYKHFDSCMRRGGC